MTSLVGSRVLRGPNWEGREADGGEGYLGTVVRLLGEGEVVVLWDTGHETTCKAGRDGEFALRVFDSAPAGEYIDIGLKYIAVQKLSPLNTHTSEVKECNLYVVGKS